MGTEPTNQTIEFDTLVLAALDARQGFDTAHRAAEGAFAILCWLSRRGVQITLDGQPFQPGQLSPHRALRLMEQRGLFEEDAR